MSSRKPRPAGERKVETHVQKVERTRGAGLLLTKAAGKGAGQQLTGTAALNEDDTRLFSRGGALAIDPPLDPTLLYGLVSRNNTLGPCVEAMNVNVHGTGWVIEPLPDNEEDEDEAAEGLEDGALSTDEEEADDTGLGEDEEPEESDEEAVEGDEGTDGEEFEEEDEEIDPETGEPVAGSAAKAGKHKRRRPVGPPEPDLAAPSPAGVKTMTQHVVRKFGGVAGGDDRSGGAPFDAKDAAAGKPPFQPKLADQPEPPPEKLPREKAALVEAKRLRGFFEEPWPGETFDSQRNKLSDDYERTGNAYYEILRTLEGEVVFGRVLDAKTTRIVKYDDPLPVEVKIERDGKERAITVLLRERRYVQVVGTQRVYHKEFGASRELNRKTGEWATKDKPVAPADRASEIIHFKCKPDSETPYGVPRWDAQIPSVLGSRLAEEFNLEYLDSGGIPPMLILVHGGKMAQEAVRDLKDHLNAKGNARVNAIVMEAYAAAGGFDTNTSVKVTVERFGSERLNDSLFENYDNRCEERVRKAFRLPPLFTGQAQEYAFATAFAAYLVAEAQVFKPERVAFDTVINNTILRALGAKFTRFRSLPLSVQDVANKLEAINIAWAASAIDRTELINQLNEAVAMEMKEKVGTDEADMLNFAMQRMDAAEREAGLTGKNPITGKPVPPGNPAPPGNRQFDMPVTKGEHVARARSMLALANEVHEAMLSGFASDTERSRKLAQEIGQLGPANRRLFNALLAVKTFGDISADPLGAIELVGCAAPLLGTNIPD